MQILQTLLPCFVNWYVNSTYEIIHKRLQWRSVRSMQIINYLLSCFCTSFLFSRQDEVGNRMFSRVHNMNLISAADLIRRKRLLRICSSLAKRFISTSSWCSVYFVMLHPLSLSQDSGDDSITITQVRIQLHSCRLLEQNSLINHKGKLWLVIAQYDGYS